MLRRSPFNRWDLVALPIVLGLLVLFAWAASQIAAPFSVAHGITIGLDPARLPEYALRTTLRMFVALAASFLFTFIYATAAAKSRRLEQLLVPLLDVLQSVPVLGYLSFTVTGFIALFPGRLLGAELAAIFAVFTSEAWNMTFSLYQSLRTLPRDLEEAAEIFRFSAWQKFCRLELPFAMPGLLWNAMMSMSGAWFFVVASEAITVGDARITLPGVGSYVALAIARKNLAAIGYAIITMLVVILLYDQLLFRPLVAWAEKFRFEQSAAQVRAGSWFLDLLRRTCFLCALPRSVGSILRWSYGLHPSLPFERGSTAFGRGHWAKLGDWIWSGLLMIAALFAAAIVYGFISRHAGWSELFTAAILGFITLVRVLALIVLATAVWLPLGILIGLRPRLTARVQPLAQFLAAFPANLLFPIAVVAILRYRLNPDIWLSPLMILGTQWYILFNVIAGASVFPTDLKDAASTLSLHGAIWWRKVIIPGVFPYFVTGAITASGGAWNASIVAEAVSWGHTTLTAHGLGAYIAEWTLKGDLSRVALGVGVMSLYVVAFNRFFWRRLYAVAERRLRLD